MNHTKSLIGLFILYSLFFVVASRLWYHDMIHPNYPQPRQERLY